MATQTGVKDSVTTMRSFLLFLMGLSLAASLGFAVLDEVTVDLLLAAAAAGIGLYYAIMSSAALAAPSAAAASRLQTLMYAFVGGMVASWIVAYLEKEFLDPVELLGVALTVLAVFLMFSITAEVRRMATS